MKIKTGRNVMEAARARVSWLFDEFEQVIVTVSGGKDSTVVLNLALEEAERRGRLPVPVLFVDQEAEWQMVIDYMRTIMSDPRVKPYWFQMPIRLFNATSYLDQWLWCWRDGDEWMRDREPDSITENTYGTDRFHKLFPAIIAKEFPGKVCCLSGVRTEESRVRFAGLTTAATYEGETWGRMLRKRGPQVTMYPIYDWSYTDVWKAIYENDWPYCAVYDKLYQFGVKPLDMRVSNLHHETAVHVLYYLHEIEPQTWVRLTKRLGGINQTHHMTKSEMFSVKSLPPMFRDWRDYRDFLLEKLVTDPDKRERMRRKFAQNDRKYGGMAHRYLLHKREVNTILTNDWEFIKLGNFLNSPEMIAFRQFQKRGWTEQTRRYPKFITGETA